MVEFAFMPLCGPNRVRDAPDDGNKCSPSFSLLVVDGRSRAYQYVSLIMPRVVQLEVDARLICPLQVHVTVENSCLVMVCEQTSSDLYGVPKQRGNPLEPPRGSLPRKALDVARCTVFQPSSV